MGNINSSIFPLKLGPYFLWTLGPLDPCMGHYRPLEPWPLGPPIGPLEPWTLEPLVLDLVPLNPYRPLEGVQGGPEGVQAQWRGEGRRPVEYFLKFMW